MSFTFGVDLHSWALPLVIWVDYSEYDRQWHSIDRQWHSIGIGLFCLYLSIERS